MKVKFIEYYIDGKYYDHGRFPYIFNNGKWVQSEVIPNPGDLVRGHYKEIWKVLDIKVKSETDISTVYRFDIEGKNGNPVDYRC